MRVSMSLKKSSQTKKKDGMYRFNVGRRLRRKRFKLLLLRQQQVQVVRMEVSKALDISVIAQNTWLTIKQVSQRIWTQLRVLLRHKLATLTGLEFRALLASEMWRLWWTWLGVITPLKVSHRTQSWPSLSSMVTTTAEVCSTARRNLLQTSTDRCFTDMPYRRKLITKWATRT